MTSPVPLPLPPFARAAEFFSGMGLVRQALASERIEVVFANDIDRTKAALYAANFGADELVCDDIAHVRGRSVPNVDLATASFPCTDLSLAGNREGLRGRQSGMFWEFVRVLSEMGARRPSTILLENVAGFGSSRNGNDLAEALSALNDLEYWCDLIVVDAAHFVPQSRKRLFIIATREPLPANRQVAFDAGPLRPVWLSQFARTHPRLRLQAAALTPLPERSARLGDVVTHFRASHRLWWDESRVRAFTRSLSVIQRERLLALMSQPRTAWATAYRRTRAIGPTWEIRADDIAGCLRTARGGSSRQAVVEAGQGSVRLRWMTSVEYARLQGAESYDTSVVSENQALFALGDAVCVPVVQWITQHYLVPILRDETATAALSEATPAYA